MKFNVYRAHHRIGLIARIRRPNELNRKGSTGSGMILGPCALRCAWFSSLRHFASFLNLDRKPSRLHGAPARMQEQSRHASMQAVMAGTPGSSRFRYEKVNAHLSPVLAASDQSKPRLMRDQTSALKDITQNKKIVSQRKCGGKNTARQR